METLGDSVGLGEAPHAHDGLDPGSQGRCQGHAFAAQLLVNAVIVSAGIDVAGSGAGTAVLQKGLTLTRPKYEIHAQHRAGFVEQRAGHDDRNHWSLCSGIPTMSMCGHVHGDAIDCGREIGAVVEVHTSQEVLVCLAVTRVLGDHHAWYVFKNIGWSQNDSISKQLRADHSLTGCITGANGVVIVSRDHHWCQLMLQSCASS
jgi:hypothetical protein